MNIKFYYINNKRIHCYRYERAELKDKPSLVLIHGLLSSEYMKPLGEYLAKNYNVYIPDLPGFGKSYKPHHAFNLEQHAQFLKEFIDQLHFTNVVLIGNSYGSQVIIRYASQHPDHISKIVLTGPTVDKNSRNLLSQLTAFILDSSNVPQWQKEYAIFEGYPKAGLKRVIKSISESINDQPEKYLPLIKVPALIVRGEKDPYTSDKWIDEITQLLPNAQSVQIPDKGHTVTSNAPEELAQIIEKFIISQDNSN